MNSVIELTDRQKREKEYYDQYAGGFDLDQDFTKFGALQVHSFNGERGARFPGDSSFGFHGDGSLQWVKN